MSFQPVTDKKDASGIFPDNTGSPARDILNALSGTGGGTRTVTVSGPAIPPGMLTFDSLSGTESLSELFHYTLRLKTPDALNTGYFAPSANLPLKSMVGRELTVSIELDGGGTRYLSGLVTGACVAGHQGRGVLYELTLQPWLKLATRTSDYKIFQHKSVVDILDEVLGDYPFPVEKRLIETYPRRSYQVQYGETDYDFLQRLMQEFGIYYYFAHLYGAHKLILVDAMGTHGPCPGKATLSFHQEGLKLDEEFIHHIVATESLRTGKWTLDDFDFTRPKAKLTSIVARPRETGHPDYERYEWPGDFYSREEGEFLTRVRMEAERAKGSRVTGNGNVRTLATGYTFTLDNCPTTEANREYLVLSTRHTIQESGQHSGQGQVFSCSVSFELLPASEIYRPARTVRKPRTLGPQSAIVTGPPGEEIHTDQYGRVKVQFPWDRYGRMDENSSCWIRVTQPWAGKGFGGMQIPRTGQEVLVDFKNGDPDLPVVVGRVYNADTMPPWGLPANKTQSGMFSRSMKGGPSNGNALRFEDKEGGEQVWLHAEKDLDTDVNNNETHTVNANRTKKIIKNETTTVGINRTETVGGKHEETITKDRIVKVTEGNESLSVVAGKSQKKVKQNIEYTSERGEITLVAAEHITFVVGASVIQLNKDGTILINGQTHVAINPESSVNAVQGTAAPVAAAAFAAQTTAAIAAGIAGLAAAIPAPNGAAMVTGLGNDVDQLAAKSPSLQNDLQALQQDGWDIQYGAPGGGSYADKNATPPLIVIDGSEQGNPAAVTQSLAHEVGHARYTYTPDYTTKTNFMNGVLGDEGAATMNNIRVQREILSNGGADIGIAGNPANHPAYEAAYNAYQTSGDAATARQTIGSIFAHGEITSTTGQSYYDYYGGWYDANFQATSSP